MAAHRHQLFTYALQPSLAAASTVSPAPPPPQPLPQPQQSLSLSSLYASSAADRYYPDATFRFLSRDGSEALTNYQATVASSSSSSAMYHHHHLPNAAAASHLAYPPQLIHQEAWPPGVEPPAAAAAAVEPLPPGVKRTSEGLSFYLILRSASLILIYCLNCSICKALKSPPFRFLCPHRDSTSIVPSIAALKNLSLTLEHTSLIIGL